MLQNVPFHVRLDNVLWNLPERQVVAVACFRSCQEQGFKKEVSLAVAAGMFKHKAVGRLLFKSVHIETARGWVRLGGALHRRRPRGEAAAREQLHLLRTPCETALDNLTSGT